MTPVEMQNRYLRGEKVDDLAREALIGRTAAYKRLAGLGTAMRANGPPKRRLALANEILEDLNAPMTLQDIQEWIGVKEQEVINALLVLLRQGSIAVVRITHQNASFEQRTLL